MQEAVDPARTLFVVSSKSGGTIEPLSLFAHFHALQGDGSHFVAITDPGSGLAELATQNGFRHVFYGDPDIGGRYSALSPFGIVPATLMGVDTAALLRRAALAWDAGAPDAGGLPGAVWLGAVLAALARSGRDKLTFAIAPSLPGLGLWLEQLVAESTGKHGTGILPVAEEPLGEPGVYGDDRVFAYLPDASAPDAAAEEALAALAAAGHPVITIPTAGPEDLGRVFLLAEIAVAVAGWGFRSTPSTSRTCSRPRTRPTACWTASRRAASCRTCPSPARPSCASCCSAPRPPITWRSWATSKRARTSTPPWPSCARPSARPPARRPPSATARASCTRPGSSTRAGRRSGASCSCSTTSAEDVEIPGRPFTFGTLEEAQAIGDLETLRELGLPAERVRLAGRGLRGRAARPDRNHQGVDMTQIGFVGLGKMGGDMVHRIRRDSDHEVVAFDFDEKAVKQAVKHGAGGAGSLRELVKKLEPPRMVWIMVPAGAPTQETVDKLAKLLDRGDTIIDGGNSKWTDDKRRSAELKKAASTTSTSASPAACGASKSATA